MAAAPDRMDLRPPSVEARDRRRRRAEPAAATPAAGRYLLFLREEELRLAQDLLFFGYRDFTAGADAILAELGMGRAHHRVLHFVGRRPGITGGRAARHPRHHQAVARPRADAAGRGRATCAPRAGRSDRRQRLLSLTAKGEALERRLFERQRETGDARLPRGRPGGGGGLPPRHARADGAGGAGAGGSAGTQFDGRAGGAPSGRTG